MVLVIIGVLLAIAVPSYLGFKDRADKSAAQSNVRSAIPAAETYYADHHNYTGMDVTALRAIGPGIRVDVGGDADEHQLHALRHLRRLARDRLGPGRQHRGGCR